VRRFSWRPPPSSTKDEPRKRKGLNSPDVILVDSAEGAADAVIGGGRSVWEEDQVREADSYDERHSSQFSGATEDMVTRIQAQTHEGKRVTERKWAMCRATALDQNQFGRALLRLCSARRQTFLHKRMPLDLVSLSGWFPRSVSLRDLFPGIPCLTCLPLVPQPQRAPTLTQLVLKAQVSSDMAIGDGYQSIKN
jgi:hypothetical protein